MIQILLSVQIHQISIAVFITNIFLKSQNLFNQKLPPNLRFNLFLQNKQKSSSKQSRKNMQNYHQRGIYSHSNHMKIPIIKINTIKQKGISFDLHKIDKIDDIFHKNQQIYQNLRKKLEGISQAERNITKNINVIRPISYTTQERELQVALGYSKYLNESSDYYRMAGELQNFCSSPIQTEKSIGETIKKKIQNSSDSSLMNNTLDANLKSSIETQTFKTSKQKYLNKKNSFKKSNHLYQAISQQPEIQSESQRNSLTYQLQSKKKNQLHQPFNQWLTSSNTYLQKQNAYSLNNSSDQFADSLVKINFTQLNNRKQQIQNIYKQLKAEEEQISKAYRDYKKNLSSLNQISPKKSQKIIKSPPKNISPKIKSFSKKKSSSSKLISKNSIRNLEINQSKICINSSVPKSFETQKEQVNEQTVSPVQENRIKFLKEEFESIQIPQKPRSMTACCYLFIPFNKLYKSPIIQMKNKSTVILARQSKIVMHKTAQHKIFDGIKYKFPQNIQTDEQELIKNLIKNQHNIIAIVGGQQTLKKKLHMSIISHSFDRIMKIVNNKKYNCLRIGLNYQQYIQKNGNEAEINKFVDFNQQSSFKMAALQVQKTIQQIYEAIKKPSAFIEPILSASKHFAQPKDKLRSVRLTKMSVMSGKQSVWACHILSCNQVSYEFLKNVEAHSIIWSINPLVKNYDEVLKTLNLASKYIEMKTQS